MGLSVVRSNQESWLDREVKMRGEADRLTRAVDYSREIGRIEGFKLGTLIGALIGLSVGIMIGKKAR